MNDDILKKLDTLITLQQETNELLKRQLPKADNLQQHLETLISGLIIKYDLPNDEIYKVDLRECIKRLGLTFDEVREEFKKLNEYSKKNEIEDIKKMSFKFLNNRARSK